MRKFTFLLTVLVLGGLSLSATPASATDQSEAVKLCGKNPSCGITRGNGGVSIQIEGSAGGGGFHAEVWCPDKGECTCLTCRIAEGSSVRGPILLGMKPTIFDGTPSSEPAPGSLTSSGSDVPVASASGWSTGHIGQWHGTINGSPGQIN